MWNLKADLETHDYAEQELILINPSSFHIQTFLLFFVFFA